MLGNMLASFKITFSNIIVLFAFIAIGYWLKKSGKIANTFNKGLSNLVVYIFLPFLTFGSMAKNFNVEVLVEKYTLLIASSALLGLFFIIAFIFSRILAKNQNTRDVYMYSFTFPNASYFGNPLIIALFGELMFFEYMIFCIPVLILTYTFGVYILNPNREFTPKTLLNPILVSLILGMAVGALNIPIPSVIQTVIDTGADCMAPAAMILTGVVFASNDVRKMISNPRVYIACAIKMLLIPIIAVFVIVRMGISENIATMVIITMTLPTGLNSIVFPEAYGGDSQTGAQLCFVATLTSSVAISFVLALYQALIA